MFEARADEFANHEDIGKLMTELFAMADEHKNILENIFITNTERLLATDNRIELGNKLYDELMILSQVGKNVWRYTSPVKYDDYIVYQSSTTVKNEETNLPIESDNYS